MRLMIRLMRTLLALLLLSSLAHPATHNGDGTFQLFLNQSIESHIHYTVLLTGIGQAGGLKEGQAGFAIYAPDGSAAGAVVLDENGTYNASFPGDGGRIAGRALSVKLYGTGYGTSPEGADESYVRVKVSSADFGVPAPLGITSVAIWPRKYDASVSWETNDGANGTAYIYDASSSRLVNSSADPASSESHSMRVGGLEPDTDYFVVAESCDLSCVQSAPQPMRTLGGTNQTGGIESGSSNQGGIGNSTTKNGTSSEPDGLVFVGAEGVPGPPRALPLIAVGALSAVAILLLRR